MPDVPIPPKVREAAQHGSWCPKMCSHACPVLAATGRDDAVPWSFHRTVDDLATGRITPDVASTHLRACTGCLGCQTACTHGQDVPAQVRAGRAAAGLDLPAVEDTLTRISAGDRVDETIRSTRPSSDIIAAAPVVIHAGCHDDSDQLSAAMALLERVHGGPPVVIADGCCGQLARDLGGSSEADGRTAHLAETLGLMQSATALIGLDPHCLTQLRETTPEGVVVEDLYTHLAQRRDSLRWQPSDALITYHDPCMLVRPDGDPSSARRLLTDAGLAISEPEHSGRDTSCSGRGMGLDIVDPEGAAATARQRRAELDAAGGVAVTACARARDHLSTDATPVLSLARVLADCLEEDE